MGCLPAARELGGGFAAGGGRGAGIGLWEAETGVARFVVGAGDTALAGLAGAAAGTGVSPPPPTTSSRGGDDAP